MFDMPYPLLCTCTGVSKGDLVVEEEDDATALNREPASAQLQTRHIRRSRSQRVLIVVLSLVGLAAVVAAVLVLFVTRERSKGLAFPAVRGVTAYKWYSTATLTATPFCYVTTTNHTALGGCVQCTRTAPTVVAVPLPRALPQDRVCRRHRPLGGRDAVAGARVGCAAGGHGAGATRV